MSQIEAVYEHGVFRPLAPIELRENQRVRLSVEVVPPTDAEDWLAGVRRFHQQFVADRGVLPDSALDIAADRVR